jgi:hypothetical protein
VHIHDEDAGESGLFEVQAFDSVAAVAKVAAMLAQAHGNGAIVRIQFAAEPALGEEVYPACDACGRSDPTVKSFDVEFICRSCLGSFLASMVDDGYLEARIRNDGEIEYRATDKRPPLSRFRRE